MQPVSESQRIELLDVLRGFALRDSPAEHCRLWDDVGVVLEPGS